MVAIVTKELIQEPQSVWAGATTGAGAWVSVWASLGGTTAQLVTSGAGAGAGAGGEGSAGYSFDSPSSTPSSSLSSSSLFGTSVPVFSFKAFAAAFFAAFAAFLAAFSAASLRPSKIPCDFVST